MRHFKEGKNPWQTKERDQRKYKPRILPSPAAEIFERHHTVADHHSAGYR
jgi:hypothetical protein